MNKYFVVIVLSTLALPVFASSYPFDSPQVPDELTVRDAIVIGLAHNSDLVAESLNFPLNEAVLLESEAGFHTRFSGRLSGSADRSERLFEDEGVSRYFISRSRTYRGDLGASKKLRDGTEIEIGVSGRERTTGGSDPSYQSRIGLDINRPLLRGAGTAVNTINVRRSEIDLEISRHQLFGYIENFIAAIERDYWDYVLATRRMEVFEQSKELSERQLAETEELIERGRLASVEIHAARAELARRREDLINAQNLVRRRRLSLLSKLDFTREFEQQQLNAVETPEVMDDTMPAVTEYVELGLEFRPEIQEADLRLQRNELEVQRTDNGLLPRLDFFLSMGQSGYASSFSDAVDDINSDNYDLQAGLTFEFPGLNREPYARHRQTQFRRRQQEIAVENLHKTVEIDIREAYLEVQRARASIDASQATLQQQQAALQAETEKLQLGRSTTLQVARVQRDYTDSQISVLQAQIDYRHALVELYRLSAILLDRWDVMVEA